MGNITSAARKELIAALRRVLGDADGNIQIFVICRADLSLKVTLGKPYPEYTRDLSEYLV